VDEGKISKDLVPKVLEHLMKGDASGVQEAIKVIGIKPMSNSELQEIIQRVLEDTSLIRERGEGSFEALMGEIMKEVRGRIEGSKVSAILRKEIDAKIGRV